jgi:hypothetical protein
MKKILLAAACFLAIVVSKAQANSVPEEKQKLMIASITTMDGQRINGLLAGVSDSGLVLNNYKRPLTVPPENIKSFTLKRKHSVLKGALIGFGVGAAVGVIVGLASGNDPVVAYPNPADDPLGIGTFAAGLNNAFAMTAGEKAGLGGLGLGTTGAIVGTIIGTVAKKKFVIGGRKEKFHDLQADVMMKLVKK